MLCGVKVNVLVSATRGAEGTKQSSGSCFWWLQIHKALLMLYWFFFTSVEELAQIFANISLNWEQLFVSAAFLPLFPSSIHEHSHKQIFVHTDVWGMAVLCIGVPVLTCGEGGFTHEQQSSLFLKSWFCSDIQSESSARIDTKWLQQPVTHHE